VKYPKTNDYGYFHGNHIDDMPNEVKQAAQFCKDVGGKESFQSLPLSAINGMLRT